MEPPHVVVIAFPFASHAVKLFRLARALAAEAPAATFSFLSTATSLAKVRNAGALQGNLRFVEVPDGSPPPPTTTGEEKVPAVVPHLVAVERFMLAAEAGGVREALEAARASAGGARVSCVVGDAFMWMVPDSAAAVKAPWVPVWTGGPSALLAHLSADALRHDVGDNAASRADELLTSHPGLHSYRVRDLPGGIVSGDPNFPMYALFRRVAQSVSCATTAIALNTFPGLVPQDVIDAIGAKVPNCLPVGPFHLLPGTDSPDTDGAPADPHGCLAWLDRHPARAVAYISFGTIAGMWAQNELHELAAGIEAAGAPFLWSLPEDSWSQLPHGFMERAEAGGAGLVVPWAPQVQVLRHASVGAFVTHAGWSSVLEGVSSGVPMACRPFISDQKMNAWSVNTWGFGTTLDDPITRVGVATAVETLLSSEEGARMLERMQELRGMAAAAFMPGGGSRDNFDKLVKMVCAV